MAVLDPRKKHSLVSKPSLKQSISSTYTSKITWLVRIHTYTPPPANLHFHDSLQNKSPIHNLSTTQSWKVLITLYMHKKQPMNLNDLLKATKPIGDLTNITAVPEMQASE